MLSLSQKKLVRFSVLLVVMIALLTVLVSRKKEAAREGQAEKVSQLAEKERQIEAGYRLLGYFDPKRRAEKPLDFPDYGNRPVFHFNGDYLELSKDHYRVAKAANEKARALKLERAGERNQGPINPPLLVNISTSQGFTEKYHKYRSRELEAYRELTTDENAVKEAGEKFLQAFLSSVLRQPDSQSDAKLLQLANNVIELGSDDPLLRTYITFVLFKANGDTIAAETMWADCIEKLRESQYPHIVQVYLRLFVIDCRPVVPPARKHALIVSIIRWLEEEADQEQWSDCIHRKLASIWDQNDDPFRLELLVCCLKSKQIDPFIQHWLTGVWLVDKGWDARGRGWTKDTSARQFRELNQYLDRARIHLEYAYFLRPDSVYPPYQMMSVALGERDRDYEAIDWFHRATENRFDYLPVYHSMLTHIMPRWGGSIDQYREFAHNCIDSNRFDTIVPYFVLNILENLLTLEFKRDRKQLERFGADQLIDQFLTNRARYRKIHPGEKLYGDTAYYRTRLGLFLEKSGRTQDAIAEYQAAQGDLDFAQLQRNHRLGKFLLYRLIAAQGEVHDRVMQFDKDLRKPWQAKPALKEIEQLEKEWQELRLTAKDDLAKQYYAHTGQVLKQLKLFSQGGWVDLSFDDKGLGWEISSDKIDWSNQDQNTLVCRETIQSQPAWARPLINIQAPFQIQAHVEQKVSHSGTTQIGIQLTDFNANVDEEKEPAINQYVGIQGHWSYPEASVPVEFRTSEELKSGYKVHSLPSKPNYSNAQSIRIMQGGMHLIDWKLNAQTAEVTLGNFPDFVRFEEAVQLQPHMMFSSGVSSKSYRQPCTSEYVWKLKNVRIRRLATGDVPEKETPIEKRIAYWENRVKNDPDDAVARFKLCEVYWEKGLVDQLLDQSNEIIAKWPELEKIRQYQGLALYKQGRYREALVALEMSMKEIREDFDVIMATAEIKAACNDDDLRDAKESLMLARFGKSCSDSYEVEFKATHWAALAVAYAENKNYAEAINANQEAIARADDNLKTELQKRQKLYEAATAYRYPPRD